MMTFRFIARPSAIALCTSRRCKLSISRWRLGLRSGMPFSTSSTVWASAFPTNVGLPSTLTAVVEGVAWTAWTPPSQLPLLQHSALALALPRLSGCPAGWRP